MKGIWNEQPGSFELYDLADDAAEKHDLAAGESPTARTTAGRRDGVAARLSARR